MYIWCRWDPKKRMTPEEAVRHEWLQPSANASYNHTKAMRERQDNAENQLSPKSQKYQRSQHLTPNTVLPDIKIPTSKYNQKTYKERTKGKNVFLFYFFFFVFQIKHNYFLGLALSANDLESAQHYSIHRLYPSRKLSNTSTTGGGGGGGTAVNIKFTNTTTGMTHSQSTGDVASMFGRA